MTQVIYESLLLKQEWEQYYLVMSALFKEISRLHPKRQTHGIRYDRQTLAAEHRNPLPISLLLKIFPAYAGN